MKLPSAGIMALTALLGALPATAQANMMTATFSGVMASGTDTTGEFGAAGANLTDLPFSVVWTYDTAQGNRNTSAVQDSIAGGPNYGVSSPLTSVVLTIGGGAVQFYDTANSSSLGTAQTRYSFDTFRSGYDGRYVSSFNLSSSAQGPFAAPNLDNTLVSVPQASYGAFEIRYFDTVTSTVLRRASGSFGPVMLTVTDNAAGAVPEPASWALMVTGFGLVGGGLRRANRKPAPKLVQA